MESTRIEDIKERLGDLTKALRRGGAPEIAARIEAYAVGFTDITQVRRSVAAIKQQLEYWRQDPRELPDMPVVHIAANRLEDTCTEALRGGVIVAARPSLRAQGRRKLTLIVTAVAAAGLVFFVPLVVTMLGMDLTDPHLGRETTPLRVTQGDEGDISVNVLVEAQEPALTLGVEMYPIGRCETGLAGGASCKAIESHEFSSGKKPSFELSLQDQAYGLIFAVTDTRVLGRVGTATILVAATDDTPEGLYRIPLQAAFIGYTPAHCTLIERVRNQCQARQVGDKAKHDALPVPTVVVQVLHGDPTRRKNEAQRKLAELERKKQEAEQRAAQLASAVSQIKDVLDDTQNILRRKRFEEARTRIDKLAQLFAPLDSLAIDDALNDGLPVEVAKLRTRFEGQSDELQGFEDKIFEQAYATLTKAENSKRDEESLLAEVARRAHVSAPYVSAIYTAHAEEIEKRMEKAKEARLAQERADKAALELRCGGLPVNTWKSVEDYLKSIVHDARTTLGECLTPRLDAAHCWTVNCDFKIKVTTSQDLPDRVISYKRTFLIRDQRVVGHLTTALP